LKTLKSYQDKRNFSLTSEPRGQAKISKSDEAIFVVQEHHASHLHYDFRLELDGALKSWAIPKGPSMNPNDKRLAVEVEDHPLEYAEFQGSIPQGQYGAGDVYIWDKGTWMTEEDPVVGLKKGKLEFSLYGKKLKGHFLLIRMKTPKSHPKNNWLLIKREDNEANHYFKLIPINKL
jgi:bifunctional non-homologous end joining protein LigD